MESDRLLFEQVKEEDYPLLKTMEAEEVQAYFAFENEADALPYLKKLHYRFFECSDGFRAWCILEKRSGKTIGLMGFHSWVFQHDRAELGYHIHSNFQNKGYATEAGKVVIEHGFKELELYRIEAFTGVENEASMNVLRKLGLTYEGRMKGHYKKGETYYDAEVFGLIRPDFNKSNS